MKFSVVTPSLNQGAFVERTIRSVLQQKGDFDLEYIIIDGGSTDSTVDIVGKYRDRVRFISESDKGQSNAINKGFRIATGDVLAWLNSDDTYEPGALDTIANVFRNQDVAWCFGYCRIIDEHDKEIRRPITAYKIAQSRRCSFNRLLRRDFIPQPACFFSRDAYSKIGELDETLSYSMDYDYWLRLWKHYKPYPIYSYLANFRWHLKSKNGGAFSRAAYETYLTAKRHAPANARFDIFLHYIHFCMLRILYRFI
jgi:glycosyltransferase involved in cell wall biosynthesis